MAFWLTPPDWSIPPLENNDELTCDVATGGRVVRGGFAPLPMTLLVRQDDPPPPPPPAETPEEGPKWSLPESIWKPRPRLANSKDFWDGDTIYKKAFYRDWNRCLNEDRFWRFVDKHDDGDGVEETTEDELNDIRQVFAENAKTLGRVFDYYCLISSRTDNSAFAIQENSFNQMMEVCFTPPAQFHHHQLFCPPVLSYPTLSRPLTPRLMFCS